MEGFFKNNPHLLKLMKQRDLGEVSVVPEPSLPTSRNFRTATKGRADVRSLFSLLSQTRQQPQVQPMSECHGSSSSPAAFVLLGGRKETAGLKFRPRWGCEIFNLPLRGVGGGSADCPTFRARIGLTATED